MKRILAFFGAFNPPTVAHLSLAETAMEQAGLEKAMFVPSKAVYIRDAQGKNYAYSDGIRLEMLRTAARHRPWMEVTDWELRQQNQPRTYETLCHLREEGWQPSLLMGSDKLPELEKGWRNVDKIAREFGIVCMSRGADDCQRMIRESGYLRALSPWIRVVVTPEALREVSSSAVREALQKVPRDEEALLRMVPPEIIGLL